jgi:hypothetical protein
MIEDLQLITDMLSYRRPMGSASEGDFIKRFLLPIGVEKDEHGNLFKVVGPVNPVVLWSAHTDSVHAVEGRQKVHFDGRYIRLHKQSTSNCLGADDAAGIFVMLGMIKAQVPGLYVFHYGEERGCKGSRALAKVTPHFLDGIQAAVAFDRRGTGNIITHMTDGRTCSDAFAASMAKQLMDYKADDGGTSTDTMSYRKLVPECTNISVGYYDEHRSTERLDYLHLIALRDQMVCFDVDALVIERDLAVNDDDDYGSSGWGNYGSFGSFGGNDYTWDPVDKRYIQSKKPDTVKSLVWNHTNDVAEMLESWGVDAQTLKDALHEVREARAARLRASIQAQAKAETKKRPRRKRHRSTEPREELLPAPTPVLGPGMEDVVFEDEDEDDGDIKDAA